MNAKIEALGAEFLKQRIQREREHLQLLDREIERLHSLEDVRRTTLAIIHEDELLLTEYEKRERETNWFYTTPRHDNELPMHTRVEVVHSEIYGSHSLAGRTGKVIGYRFCPGAIFPTGWHYLMLDGDTTKYPTVISQPYVHRDYLQVIE